MQLAAEVSTDGWTRNSKAAASAGRTSAARRQVLFGMHRYEPESRRLGSDSEKLMQVSGVASASRNTECIFT